ncbi:M23 family metallopeptidase [Streptacidiphilus sp. MAP5-3]|uniref:M23 family metallopeptidase n=1 Tax=unclassified Streptacidiphilus TaxID=2643834 RepID=UPI003517B5E5
MASYPVETVAEPTATVPRQRGAALGLAAMAVGASSVIGLAGPALAADHSEHGGPTGTMRLQDDEQVPASHGSDAGVALADRILAQAVPQRAAENTARREAASAATAKAQAVERARLAESLVAPLTAVHSDTGRGAVGSYWAHLHAGLDLAAPAGTAVRAMGTGTITEAGWAGSYGYRVVQTLPDGTEIWYCHLSAITVAGGGSVAAGQPLGRVGATASSTGPHLHLEIRPDGAEPVDPTAWLASRGVNL